MVFVLYLGKANSKLKKYKKYAKKLAKYGGTTKHYKEGFKALENLVKQYENQYQNTLREQQKAKQTYGSILRQAREKEKSILNYAQKERNQELNKLAQAGVDYYQFNDIGVYSSEGGSIFTFPFEKGERNSSKRGFLGIFSGISTIQINGGIMGAEAGLATAKSITKQIKKLSHKIKKKYKKAVKKAKKKEAKRIAKLQAQREQQRRAYYRKIAWQKEQAEKAQRLAYTHYDQYGNGYSSMYNNYYSDGVKTNSFLAYPSNTKTPWYKKLFGTTAYASTIKVDYKPKKSWFGKIKDFGKGIKNWIGDKLSQGFTWVDNKINNSNLYPSVKEAWNGTVASIKNTWQVATKGIMDAVSKPINILKISVQYIKQAIKELSQPLIDGVKTIGLFVGGRIEWYTEWRKKKKEEKEKIEDLKENSALPAMASEVVYEKDDEEEKIQEEEFAKAGYVKVTDDAELEKYGLSMEDLEDTDSGLRARLYVNKTTGEVILAFAGTDPSSPADTKADVEQSLGLKTKQYEQARIIGEKLQTAINNGTLDKSKLVITGHSLGGGEASLVGVMTGAKTYVFNAAGLHPNTLKDAGVTTTDFSNIVNFRTAGDLLTHMQEKADTQEIDYFLKLKGVIKRSPDLDNTVKPIFDKYYTNNLSPEAIQIIDQHLANHDKLKDILPDAVGQQVDVGSQIADAVIIGASKAVDDLPVLKYTDDLITGDFNNHSIDITLETLWGAHQHTNIYHYNN